MQILKDYLRSQPHGKASQITREMGIARPLLTQWANGQRGLPSSRVLSLARATGFELTPHQLNPGMYPNPDDGLPNDPAGRPGA